MIETRELLEWPSVNAVVIQKIQEPGNATLDVTEATVRALGGEKGIFQ